MSARDGAPAPPHWIRHNQASRWPHRWIVWDSETRSTTNDGVTEHTFRCAVACWWDHKLKTHSEPEYATFSEMSALWGYVDAHAEHSGRTICYAHNLSFDVQVCRMFDHLPLHGWELEWFNLDRDATLISWRRGAQSLIFTDSLTLFPAPLGNIAGLVKDEKPPLPANDASEDEWLKRCKADVRVLTAAVRQFNSWARETDIGNWRPSGSGLAWSLWRHKFLAHDILASSGPENSAAERAGMITGRSECWQTTWPAKGGLHEWDMARAYCRIASQVDVPVRHRWTAPSLTLEQYRGWREQGPVLSAVTVTQAIPIVGLEDGNGYRWPVGTFATVLWSPEIDLLLACGARVAFGESRRYFGAPALKAWADWTLAELTPETQTVPDVVQLWVKSQSRSLIGRFGMRYHRWSEHPDGNGLDMVGLSREGGRGLPNRTLMHLGRRAWVEEERVDSDDCVPAITGYVMSEARVRLWRAMEAVGEAHLWHVDTDGVLVDDDGDRAMWEHARENPDHGWTPKGDWASGEVRSTRNFSLGEWHHIAGVPSKAYQVGPNTWHGEQWQGMRQGLREGRIDRVLVRPVTFTLDAPDGRRVHLDGGKTRAYAPGEYAEMYPQRAEVR